MMSSCDNLNQTCSRDSYITLWDINNSQLSEQKVLTSSTYLYTVFYEASIIDTFNHSKLAYH